MIKISEVKTDDEFIALKHAWDQLLDLSSVEDITLTWEWLYTWWDVFKEDRKLCILSVYDNKEIIGIAPLLNRNVRYYGILPFRRIELLGTGEDEKDEVCSDYLDFIVKKGQEREVAEALFSYLIEKSNEWDELYLADVLETSIVIKHFIECCKRNNIIAKVIEKYSCPYVDLPSKWEDLIKTSTRNFRKQLNKKKRLIEKEGIVDYFAWSDNERYEEAFMKLMELHQKNWTAKGKSGCFASEKFTAFHRRIFNLFMPLNKIVVHFLKVNNQYIAGRYCLDYKNKLYGYLTGLDAAFKKNISPGFLLLAFSIEDAIKRGKKKFDFFKASKESHKYRWTDKERLVLTTRIVHHNGLKNSLYCVIRNIKSLARKVFKHNENTN